MNRDRIIKFRVNDKEWNIIMEKALQSGRNVSELTRDSVLDKEIIIIGGLNEMAKELRYQGNNINQLTVMARQGRINLVDFKPFAEVMKQVWQLCHGRQGVLADATVLQSKHHRGQCGK